jgi:hypothetical protein
VSDPDKSEQLVSGLLREQPLRRAPSTLQGRVLTQLGSRVPAQASGPWWGRGFSHWPLAARIAFVIASVGFVRVAMLGVMSVSDVIGSHQVTHEVAGAVGPAFTWLHAAAVMVGALDSLGGWIVRTIPAVWLYGAAALGVLFYAALFGLGTVAYRTLYVNK